MRMGKRAVLLLTVVAAMLLASSGILLAQPTTGSFDASKGNAPKTPTDKIPDKYIVVLNDDVSDPGEVGRQHANEHALSVGFVYRNAIKGYSATIPNARALERVRNDEDVKYVEQDGVASAVAQTLPWGIDKIEADKSSTLAGNGSGTVSGVNAYIIDSGIDTAHQDLNAKMATTNFAGGKNTDCNGHGTHVAGTVAAKDDTSAVVGVAPGAPLIGVKVLGCSGSGSWSGVIAGIDWVTKDARAKGVPAVANMSLGGGANQAVDDAVKGSAASGIFYAVAAGNDSVDACKNSPARAGKGDNGILTVGATDKSDQKASFSNTNAGGCIDIWAPGVSILSTKKGGGTTSMSGTSMASPHGAGASALYRSKNTGATPTSVETQLKNAGQTVSLNPSKRLLVSTF